MIGGFKLTYTIHAGYETNHLRVELQDGQLTFLINGTSVSQISGLSYTSGLVGLLGESASYAGFEVSFDNLQVTEQSTEEGFEAAPPP